MKASIFIGLFMALLACPVWVEQPQTCDGRSKITTTGEAVVNVRPNKIVITETEQRERTVPNKLHKLPASPQPS